MRFLAGAASLALAASATPSLAFIQPPTAATSAPAETVAPEAADAPVEALADETAPANAKTPGDPYEGFNRAVWGFNRVLDRFIVKPVTVVYRTIVPRVARRGISRAFANLNEPWSFVNNMLQAKPKRAIRNLGRFVVNTTIGVAGLADPATKIGIRPAQEDFGQTLAVWGVAKSSAYLVLPLLGPSTVRDGIGSGIGMVADPVTICLRECTNLSWTERWGIQAARVVSVRSDLIENGADAFLDSSLDPYATARSAYFQGRAAAIANEEADAGSGATPDNLDPRADTPAGDPATLDAVPAGTSPTEPPAADAASTVKTPPSSPTIDPAESPAAEPAPTPTPAAGTDAPKLSFNLAQLQG